MITLNGKTFAPNSRAAVDSLFKSGGTDSGTYKALKTEIQLFDLQGNHIATINRHAVLCHVTKLDNGKKWYSHATVSQIGEWASYMQRCDELRAALQEHLPRLVSTPCGKGCLTMYATTFARESALSADCLAMAADDRRNAAEAATAKARRFYLTLARHNLTHAGLARQIAAIYRPRCL